MIVHDVEQGTEAWARIRCGMPTCSQLNRILSPKKLTPSSQAIGYRNLLVAEWLTGYLIELGKETGFMAMGREMEPEARKFYEFDRDCTVQTIGFVTDDEGKFGGSPDGIVGEDGILEIKCPAFHTQVGYLIDPPLLEDTYRSQVQGYMYLTGRKWTDLIAYNPDLPPVIRRIEPDADYLNALAKVLPAFIAHLDEAKALLAAHRIVLEAADAA